MVANEISVKKYVVRLSADERGQLEVLIRKGKSPAQRLLKARILLKADVSQAGDSWSDSRIIKALEASLSMVYRVRKQLVEEGFEVGVEPQTARDASGCADLRRREGGQADCLGLFQTAQGTGALDLAVAGEERWWSSRSSSAPATQYRSCFKNVWPAPSARGFRRDCRADQSASTYPASRNSLRPRWRYARSGPHKSLGVERRFLNQACEAPFDCQAISSSPCRKHPRRPAVSRTAELLTPPLAFL